VSAPVYAWAVRGPDGREYGRFRSATEAQGRAFNLSTLRAKGDTREFDVVRVRIEEVNDEQ
jgi:hypothetical protein